MSDKSQKMFPRLTVDPVLFVYDDKKIKVLLTKRHNQPQKDAWALPGGNSYANEKIKDNVVNWLHKKTDYPKKNIRHIQQLQAFDTDDVDPRGHAVTVSFLLLGNSYHVNKHSKLFDINDLPQLAFDHISIVKEGIRQLKLELSTTTMAQSLLPKKTTLNDIFNIYQSVFDKQIDNRNFRKKFLAHGALKDTGELELGVPNRPSKLYSFKAQSITPLNNSF